MGFFSFLFSKATGGIIESAGEAITKVVRVTKGDKAAVEGAIADEQLATLASHAAEFAARGERTKLDSAVDFLNRLPRPLFVFLILFLFIWPYFDIVGFVEYMRAMEVVPETIWTAVLTLLAFYFGGRLVAHDLRKPKLSPEQKKLALDIIKEREAVILENRTPLIVEVAPSKKPPMPQWAIDALAKEPPTPVFIPLPSAPPVKGRSADVDEMIEEILRKEGGFVNDPSDSGGATNYGITINTLSAWREAECSVDDVKALTKEESKDIYLKEYYFGPSIDSLPLKLQAHVMDCCVNAGPRTGVRLMQEALNVLGAAIKTDGIVGPVTREACNGYDITTINNELVKIRVDFYTSLAARRPKDQKFLKGWLIRARSFEI